MKHESDRRNNTKVQNNPSYLYDLSNKMIHFMPITCLYLSMYVCWGHTVVSSFVWICRLHVHSIWQVTDNSNLLATKSTNKYRWFKNAIINYFPVISYTKMFDLCQKNYYTIKVWKNLKHYVKVYSIYFKKYLRFKHLNTVTL